MYSYCFILAQTLNGHSTYNFLNNLIENLVGQLGTQISKISFYISENAIYNISAIDSIARIKNKIENIHFFVHKDEFSAFYGNLSTSLFEKFDKKIIFLQQEEFYQKYNLELENPEARIIKL